MSTYEHNYTIEGPAAVYNMQVPDATLNATFNSGQADQWVKFKLTNLASSNVSSVITFSGFTVTGGIVVTQAAAGFITGTNTPFNSGDELAPGQSMEVRGKVTMPTVPIGETANGTVTVDIDHVQA